MQAQTTSKLNYDDLSNLMQAEHSSDSAWVDGHKIGGLGDIWVDLALKTTNLAARQEVKVEAVQIATHQSESANMYIRIC